MGCLWLNDDVQTQNRKADAWIWVCVSAVCLARRMGRDKKKVWITALLLLRQNDEYGIFFNILNV